MRFNREERLPSRWNMTSRKPAPAATSLAMALFGTARGMSRPTQDGSRPASTGRWLSISKTEIPDEVARIEKDHGNSASSSVLLDSGDNTNLYHETSQRQPLDLNYSRRGQDTLPENLILQASACFHRGFHVNDNKDLIYNIFDRRAEVGENPSNVSIGLPHLPFHIAGVKDFPRLVVVDLPRDINCIVDLNRL